MHSPLDSITHILGICSTHPYTGARVSSIYARTHVPMPRRLPSKSSAVFCCLCIYVQSSKKKVKPPKKKKKKKKLAERTERITVLVPCVVVVPMFRALIMIASVDAHGRVAKYMYSACYSSICLIFSTSQNAATAFVFKHKKSIDITDFSWTNTIRYRFWWSKAGGIRIPKNWNYALKLKIDTPKINWG